jgi:hypothetical protein
VEPARRSGRQRPPPNATLRGEARARVRAGRAVVAGAAPVEPQPHRASTRFRTSTPASKRFHRWPAPALTTGPSDFARTLPNGVKSPNAVCVSAR